MNYRLLSLITFSGLLFGFADATAQTTANGHHLDNSSVGFYGFCLDIPMDYEPYTPPTEKKPDIKTYADFAWYHASHLDRHAGFTTIELIPYKSNRSGLTIAVMRSAVTIPPLKDKVNYLRQLDMFTTWTIKRSKKDLLRDTRQIGDIHVSRIATLSDGNVTAANIVLIPPATVLVFYGACHETKKDDLLADLDAIIATLNIGKKGPH